MDDRKQTVNPDSEHDVPFRLGCPIWASEAWVGSLYSTSRRTHWLKEYSRVFNTVEGNSTFYGLPHLDTVRRWADDTEDGFHFVLKFPRDLSHEGAIDRRQRTAEEFLEILNVLFDADRLGPAMLQLPPHFSGQRFGELERLLSWLPKRFRYAVEVRHTDFFDGDVFERGLDELLESLEIDRVHLDSRALFSAPASDEYETQSQQRKPRLPYRRTVTASRPIIRLIGRNIVEMSEPWIDEWAKTLAGWITIGLHPYLFTHTPDDAHAPDMARRFHERLSERVMLPAMPDWPGESAPKQPKQRELF